MDIFTIGFTKTSAQGFFDRLLGKPITKLVDVRLRPSSQLAGFAKQADLEYFLREIGQMDYFHMPELTPTQEMLKEYQAKAIDWDEYERRFTHLIDERNISKILNPKDLENSVLLCSEDEPSKCHRRLLVEFLADKWGNVNIHHL